MAEKDFVNYYHFLGVDSTADDDEIKKKYRKLALEKHPDRNRDNAKADEIFAHIVEAKEVLLDKKLRAAFDIEYSNYMKKEKELKQRKAEWDKLDAKRKEQIAKLEEREKLNENRFSESNAHTRINKINMQKLIKEELERLRNEMKNEKEKQFKEKSKNESIFEKREKEKKIENELLNYYYKNYTIIAKYKNKNDSNNNYSIDDLKHIFDHYCRKNYLQFDIILIDKNDIETNDNFDLKWAIINDRKYDSPNGRIVSLKFTQNDKKIIVVFDNIMAVYQAINDCDDLNQSFNLSIKFVGNKDKLSVAAQAQNWQKFKTQARIEHPTHHLYLNHTQNVLNNLDF